MPPFGHLRPSSDPFGSLRPAPATRSAVSATSTARLARRGPWVCAQPCFAASRSGCRRLAELKNRRTDGIFKGFFKGKSWGMPGPYCLQQLKMEHLSILSGNLTTIWKNWWRWPTYRWFTHKNGGFPVFSIAMFKYQRESLVSKPRKNRINIQLTPNSTMQKGGGGPINGGYPRMVGWSMESPTI